MHQRLTKTIPILLIVSVGLACSFLRPKTKLTWHILLEIDPAASDRQDRLAQTIDVIKRRLDAFGVGQPEVTAQGVPSDGRILVNLPEVTDRARLTALITTGGLLELLAVVSRPNPMPVETFAARDDALASLGGTLPEDRRVLRYQERAEPTTAEKSRSNDQSARWVIVESPAIVDGSELRNAHALALGDDDGTYNITFSLTPQGAQKFGDWTGSHINNYIGVALNGEVKSIAFIKSRITDQGEISGSFTKNSAQDLALILRAGALPVTVKIIETADNK
jgi:preprotein translocase subunit SecD